MIKLDIKYRCVRVSIVLIQNIFPKVFSIHPFSEQSIICDPVVVLLYTYPIYDL